MLLKELIKIVDGKGKYRKDHSEKVTYYAVRIAEKLGLPKDKINDLIRVCMLHDVGKIAVDSHILNKKEPLTKAEWAEIKRHTEIGARIARRAPLPKSLIPAIRHHHEKFSGGGYPDPKMKRVRIPLYARILAVADAWDAMRSSRAYRKALPKRRAINELKRCSGTQFDPNLVNTFLSLV